MALNDMYEVVDRQSVAGQEVLNVFHVERDNVGVTANDVAKAYENTFLVPSLGLSPIGATHTLIEVRNLDDPLDFASITPSPFAGTRPGDAFSNFNALSAQFNRLRTDMKNGQKRFCWGSEPDKSGNIWIAAFVTETQAVVDLLLATWERGNQPGVPMCNYVIIKRICTTSPSPPCIGGYRLPETDGELVFYRPQVAIVRDTARSQVSRKRLV